MSVVPRYFCVLLCVLQSLSSFYFICIFLHLHTLNHEIAILLQLAFFFFLLRFLIIHRVLKMWGGTGTPDPQSSV